MLGKEWVLDYRRDVYIGIKKIYITGDAVFPVHPPKAVSKQQLFELQGYVYANKVDGECMFCLVKDGTMWYERRNGQIFGADVKMPDGVFVLEYISDCSVVLDAATFPQLSSYAPYVVRLRTMKRMAAALSGVGIKSDFQKFYSHARLQSMLDSSEEGIVAQPLKCAFSTPTHTLVVKYKHEETVDVLVIGKSQLNMYHSTRGIMGCVKCTGLLYRKGVECAGGGACEQCGAGSYKVAFVYDYVDGDLVLVPIGNADHLPYGIIECRVSDDLVFIRSRDDKALPNALGTWKAIAKRLGVREYVKPQCFDGSLHDESGECKCGVGSKYGNTAMWRSFFKYKSVLPRSMINHLDNVCPGVVENCLNYRPYTRGVKCQVFDVEVASFFCAIRGNLSSLRGLGLMPGWLSEEAFAASQEPLQGYVINMGPNG